ncbi:hypothetical protein BJX70DRAFT_355559 [Aspergillus crustosus]
MHLGMIDPFSPQLIWTIANISVVRAVWCFISPATQYEEFGLPLEQPSSTSPTPSASATTTAAQPRLQAPNEGTISPLIYTKGIRDFAYGVLLLTVRNGKDQNAATVVIMVGALMSAGDAFVVWRFGGQRWKTAWRHAVIAGLFYVWYSLRLSGKWK